MISRSQFFGLSQISIGLTVVGTFLAGSTMQFDLRDLQQALADLLLVLGESRQRVDSQEQLACFLLADIEDFHVHFYMRVKVASEMAVDPFQPAAALTPIPTRRSWQPINARVAALCWH